MYLQDQSYQSYLFHFFDTFEKWLTRDKLWSTSNQVSFLRFVQKCRILARYYADTNPSPRRLDNLLENEPNIQALRWLKEKKEVVLELKAERLPIS